MWLCQEASVSETINNRHKHLEKAVRKAVFVAEKSSPCIDIDQGTLRQDME